MSRRRHKHTPTNPCSPQLPGGLWSWIKNHLAAIFGHRLCDNILKFVGILLSAAGLFGLGAWYNKSSSSSGSNSPSISGDNNNVTILCNAHSAEEIAKAYNAVAKSRKNHIKQMKDALLYAMDNLDLTEMPAGDLTIKIKKNGGVQPLVITGDVPESMNKVIIEPDNDKIREILKDNEVGWAHLEPRGRHIEIK